MGRTLFKIQFLPHYLHVLNISFEYWKDIARSRVNEIWAEPIKYFCAVVFNYSKLIAKNPWLINASATQRKRHLTKGLMSRTIAVHVHYKALYISLPSSTKQLLGSLSKVRRRRQRERHKTKGLMSRTMEVHVRFNFFINFLAVLCKTTT